MSTKVSSSNITTQNGGANNIPTIKSSNTNNQPVLKLSQLQNFCKRDPAAYKEDYDAQSRRLVSLVGILLLSPNADNPSSNLVELIQFMAAVSSSSYKGEESDKVANLLMDLLVGTTTNESNITQPANHAKSIPLFQPTLPLQALNLHRDIRKACVSALILMRNKGAIPPLRLLQLFFQLMSVVPDKNLRESLYHHIVNDIRNINKNGKKDEKLNRVIQGYFHRIVMASASEGGSNRSGGSGEDSPTDYAAKRATQMICDLYRRNIWNDERSIHILASAATSPNPSVMSKSLRFFLNIEETMNRDKLSSEEDKWQGSLNIDLHLHSKKTKHKKRVISKQLKNRQKIQHEREGIIVSQRHDKGVESSKKLFPAIELLNDPYGICETLLKRIKNSSGYKFEIKMLMLNFVTRVIGNHELIVLPLYTLLQRYMNGHQRDVTSILAYTVQSCHSLVPPEEVYGVLKCIIHEFVTERCSGEQMAVGINACRAICVRVPSVLSGDDDNDMDDGEGEGGVSREKSTSWDVEAFVRDLASYAKHRDRSVSIAGRGWVNFIREVYPSLLQGKDRGLVGAGLHKSGERPLRYGEVKAATGVAGADLLVEYEASKKRKEEEDGRDEGDESGSDGEEEEEDDWVDVKSGDEGGKVDEWEEVASGDEDDDDEEEDEIKMEESDGEEEAPDLVLLKDDEAAAATSNKDEPQDKKKELSDKDRSKLKQEVSSTRIFTTAEFAKMQKLVDREQRAKRDPRLAAKLKRAKAKGEEFADLSDSDSDMDSDDDDVHVKGAVNAMDIMAEAKRKRVSKAEKLEKIIAGREKWEAKDRAGGSTNTEKKRKKNFAMSKFAFATRQKIGEKSTAKSGRLHGQKKKYKDNLSSKKRRRKF